MELTTWSRRIKELAGVLDRLASQADAPGMPPTESASWHAILHRKLRPQLGDDPYLIVAVAGGTNIGKSTVFNHLTGFPASRVHPDATQTKHPVCLLPRGFLARHDLSRAFPGFELKPWASEDDAIADGPSNRLIYREDPSGTQPENLVLLDTPDVDGALLANWDRAKGICHAADVVIAVLTDQKYNDAAVRRFFREAAEADKTVLVVFNMVEWPEDRRYCERWLETFRNGTGATAAHVYAAPRDREAARSNRLTFHPLSAQADDPRRDLAGLHFGEIKLRSLRGALRRLLDPVDGVPAYLDAVEQVSAEYARALNNVRGAVSIRVDAPELPGHVVIDEIWNWLEPRRTAFDRAVHTVYGKVGGLLVGLWPWRRDREEQEADFAQAEGEMLRKALAEIYDHLEALRSRDPVLSQELEATLSGEERERAFRDLDDRHARMPLSTEHYRLAVAHRMDAFERQNPAMVRAIRWGLVATAVIRPAITIGAFGVSDIAIHTLIHQGGHSAIQAGLDALAAALVTAGGEGFAHRAQRGSLETLLKDLIEDFYKERVEQLRGAIHDCALGRHLDRIEQLARLPQGDDFREARAIVEFLRDELPRLDADAELRPRPDPEPRTHDEEARR
jgi:hypothetical protein